MGLISPSQLLIWIMRGMAMLLVIPMHEAAHAFVSDGPFNIKSNGTF